LSLPLWGVIPARASGISSDHDCNPRGIIAIAKEKPSPKSFWTVQLKNIQNYVESQEIAYKLYIINKKRDTINKTIDNTCSLGLSIGEKSAPCTQTASSMKCHRNVVSA
jgi:hypothetical protein